MSEFQVRTDADALIGVTLSGKFLIRRLVGQGGMGVIFEAEHVVTRRIGALKLLHSSFAASADVVERFTREASAAGRINSERIVQTFDAGRLDDGVPYMFMELLSGLTLEELLCKRGSLRFDEAAAIAIQAAEGLAAAHAAGIVHRDIKPANLFLVHGGQSVKLLDFGISKFAAQTGVRALTSAGTAMGTPHYMPPEQIVGGQALDERADIYALGVVLYECVVGRPPYHADTLPALSVLIYEGKYLPISQQRTDTPAGFDAIVARCLTLAPAERFASADALVAALVELFGGNTASLMPTAFVSSIPPRAASRASKPERTAASQTSALGGDTLPPGTEASGTAPRASGGPSVATLPVKPRVRRSVVLGALLALLGLMVIAFTVLSTHGQSSAVHLPASAALTPTTHEPPKPLAESSAGSPAEATPENPVETQAAAANPSASPRPRAATSRPHSPAARDGLQERNPYED